MADDLLNRQFPVRGAAAGAGGGVKQGGPGSLEKCYLIADFTGLFAGSGHGVEF